MKTLRLAALVAAVGLLLAAGSARAGLTGYWPLDTLGPGNTFADATGQGHTATIHGTGVVTPAGHVGNALQFTGDINDRLLVSPEVDLGNAWTLSAWSKNFWSSSTWRTLFRGSNKYHPLLVQNGTNHLGTHGHPDSGFHDSGYVYVPGSGPGGWDHLVGVGEVNDTAFFLNGVYVGSSDFKPTDNLGAIGNNYGAGQKFSELLDDVAVWDEPLRVNQIQSLTTLAASPQSLPQADPLAGWWKLDETGGTAAADATGNGFHATVAGANWVNDPQRGRVLQLTGNLNDTVKLNRSVDIGDEWTITGWFKDLLDPSHWRTFARGETNHHPLLIENGGWELGTYENGGANFVGSGVDMSVYDDGLWHHIAAKGIGGSTLFYIDGGYVGQSGFQALTDVGSLGNNYTGGQKFSNYLDDLAVFNTALADWQIRGLGNGYFGPGNIPVPEPASLLVWSLLAGLGIGLAWRRRG